jgi:hypothetical protein
MVAVGRTVGLTAVGHGATGVDLSGDDAVVKTAADLV